MTFTLPAQPQALCNILQVVLDGGISQFIRLATLPFAAGVDWLNYMLLYCINTITSLLTAMPPGMPDVQAPIATQIAQISRYMFTY
jgi:hypothetical protein